jgi:periplasmic glucans biosynthesis protein
VATRTGVHEWQPEQRTITVDFAGGRLAEESPAPLEAQVEALGEAREKVLIQGVSVQALPEGRWRAAFQIAPAEEGGKLSELGPVELRCALKRGDDYLTETWTYRVIP